MAQTPFGLMKNRFDLYGFAYNTQGGSKQRTPVLKKSKIRCNVQDTPPNIITWYMQRQELLDQL